MSRPESPDRYPSRRGALRWGAIATGGLIAAPGLGIAQASTFKDVRPSQQFAREIQWMRDKGLATGWPDGTYRPLRPIARDAFAAFLYRLQGEPAHVPPAISPFTDVPPTDQFYREITWAYDAGLVTGWPDGTYRPLANVARDAAVVIFHRLAGSPRIASYAAYRDVRPGMMYRDEMGWARNTGLMLGWPDGTFRPTASIARDAMAALVYRYVNGGVFGKGITVEGGIAGAYWAAGGLDGRLGKPKGDERAVVSGSSGVRGFRQDFAGGLVLYSSRTGGHAVGGGLLGEYTSQGGVTGKLGFPTSGERSYGAGWRQDFEGGYRTFYSGWNPPENLHGPVRRITPLTGGVTIRRGWNGTRVRIIQKKLGVHRTGTRQTYDLGTENAVRAFQRRNGLTVDGVVGPQTWRRLAPEYPFTMDAWQAPIAVSASATREQRIEALVRFCEAQRGTPYTWGGAGYSNASVAGFDCSGLVLQGMYAAGLDPQPINVLKHAEPTYRTSQQLYADKRLASFPVSQRKRGDLIFFSRTQNGPVTHVALYVGGGRMMESWGATAGHHPYSSRPHNGYYYTKPTLKRPFA